MSWASSAAFPAIPALAFVFCAISEMEADSSSTAAACWVEPWASAWEPSAICFDPTETCAVEELILLNISFRLSITSFKDVPIVSDGETKLTSRDKSPPAIISRSAETFVMCLKNSPQYFTVRPISSSTVM
jgi:hypothetical protein